MLIECLRLNVGFEPVFRNCFRVLIHLVAEKLFSESRSIMKLECHQWHEIGTFTGEIYFVYFCAKCMHILHSM